MAIANAKKTKTANDINDFHEQLKAILGSSPEFLNLAQTQDTTAGLTTTNEKIVDFLFQKVLKRTADASGLEAFTTALDNGISPLTVASAIVSSQEANSDAVNGLYTQLLKRQADGTGLERVTTNPSFDGFPMWSHDGKKLVFASNRADAKPGETNIFIADWVWEKK